MRNNIVRMPITPDNPNGHDRYGYAWQQVPTASRAHLDFGCGRGGFLDALSGKHIKRRIGADVSREIIEKARQKYPELEFVHLSKGGVLPFDDKAFSSVSLLDVIEHIAEQDDLLKECKRVMADDGILIVTVPGKHFFSFLDMGNFKFYFPRLHRWYFCRRYSRSEYEYRYVSNPDGLVGDVSVEKGIHEHFTQRKLKILLEKAGFQVVEFDGTGYFSRPLGLLVRLFRRFAPAQAWLHNVMQADARRFASMNLFCTARPWKGHL